MYNDAMQCTQMVTRGLLTYRLDAYCSSFVPFHINPCISPIIDRRPSAVWDAPNDSLGPDRCSRTGPGLASLQ